MLEVLIEEMLGVLRNDPTWQLSLEIIGGFRLAFKITTSEVYVYVWTCEQTSCC